MEENKCEEMKCPKKEADSVATEFGSVTGEELAALKTRLDELEEGEKRLLRLQADFDNFRRRTQREKEELMDYAAMTLISKFLPIMDNFERALATTGNTQDNQGVMQGVEMIYRQLADLLLKEGVTEIAAQGQPFDPDFHHAVMHGPVENVDDDTVTDVLQKGYVLKDKVMRPAMVKVARK